MSSTLAFIVALLINALMVSSLATADAAKKRKKTTFRKTQEVSFDGADIDGVVRSPDGAYLLQKRGIKFMPLYRVEKQFDQDIKESIEYLR